MESLTAQRVAAMMVFHPGITASELLLAFSRVPPSCPGPTAKHRRRADLMEKTAQGANVA